MVQTATDKNLIAEQIVATVLGDESDLLGDQVDRVARSYDEATATSLARSLAEHLAHHPDGLRELEALVILGLAHPSAMMANRIALGQEGRRLANRLEATGETLRAQSLLELLSQNDPRDRSVDKQLVSIMRRTGNIDRLVERYLSRADEAVADGRRRDAITWLREVLMLDRSRRDVARMIRDLQYEARAVKEGWSRRFRMVGIVLLVAAMGVGLVYRELHVQRAYQGIEPAVSGNLGSLQARISSLDSLLSGSPLWIGMFGAGRERAALRAEIDQLEAKAAVRARKRADRRAEKLMVTDAARMRGLLMLEERDLGGAAAQFEIALEQAPADWEHRARLEADIAAIEEYLARPDSTPDTTSTLE